MAKITKRDMSLVKPVVGEISRIFIAFRHHQEGTDKR
jgi:hypothetical protein